MGVRIAVLNRHTEMRSRTGDWGIILSFTKWAHSEIYGMEIPAFLQEVLDNSSDYSWFIVPAIAVEKYDVTGYFAKATFTTNEKTKKSKLFTVSAIVNESSK